MNFYFTKYKNKCFKTPACYQETQKPEVDTDLSISCYIINTVDFFNEVCSFFISTEGYDNNPCWPHASNKIIDPWVKVEQQTTKDKVTVIVGKKTWNKIRISKGIGAEMIPFTQLFLKRQTPEEAQGCWTFWLVNTTIMVICIYNWARDFMCIIPSKLYNKPTRGITGHNWVHFPKGKLRMTCHSEEQQSVCVIQHRPLPRG